MSSDLHSPSWYRVAELRPRLRSHVRIHRHHYRGELWYVLEDRVSRRMHRFNPVAHYAIGLMDGHRSVQQIWDAAIARFGDDAPTQDEMIRLLGQLHAADVLQSEVTPDVAELLRRAKKGARKTWKQNLLSPMAVRIPLIDPDRFLERWLAWYRPLFGWGGFVLWCLVVASGAFAAAQHWPELSRDFSDRVLAPQNLLLMWLTFPLLKLCHEFGHACATKAWGGEVHEMGIMFLVLMPIPYVDATAASAFRADPAPGAGGGGGHGGRGVHRLARPLPLARRAARAVPRRALQRDADRRRVDGVLQRQSAAALRRLLHPVGPDPDPEPAQPRAAVPRAPDRDAACSGSSCPSSRRAAARSAGSCSSPSPRSCTAPSSCWRSRCSSPAST